MSILHLAKDISPAEHANLSRVIEWTRSRPAEFASGARLLAEEHSPERIAARKAQDIARDRAAMRERWKRSCPLDRNAMRIEGRRDAEWLRTRRGILRGIDESSAMQDALDRARRLLPLMPSRWAQAVCLLAAAIVDPAGAPNPAFPEWLERWRAMRHAVVAALPGMEELDAVSASVMLKARGTGTSASLMSVLDHAVAQLGALNQRTQAAPVATRRAAPVDEANTETRLLALIIQHPGKHVSEIAELAGVHRSTPYRYPRVKAALRACQGGLEDRKDRARRALSRDATDDETSEE